MRKFLAPVAALGLLLAMAGTALAWADPDLDSECAPDGITYAWTIDLHEGEDNYLIELAWDHAFTNPWEADFVTAGDHSFTTPRDGATLWVRFSDDHDAKDSAEADDELCPAPAIEIVKSHNTVGTVLPGATVTYSYAVENTGNTPLSNVEVIDKIAGTATIACDVDSEVFIGDANDDGTLDPGETWTFTCTTTLAASTANSACVSADVGAEKHDLHRIVGRNSDKDEDEEEEVASIEACATDAVTVSPSPAPVGQGAVQAATGTPAATLPDASVNGIGSNPLPAIVFSMMLLASLAALAYVNLKSVGIRSGR